VKGCVGVVSGLIIGAALAFSALLVVALADGDDAACVIGAPERWSVRVEIPADTLTSVSSGSFDLAGSGWKAQVSGIEPLDCRRVLARFDLVNETGWRLPGLGLELRAKLVESGVSLAPGTLWVGPMPVPAAMLLSMTMREMLLEVNATANAAMAEYLSPMDLTACGLVTDKQAVHLYLCHSGTG